MQPDVTLPSADAAISWSATNGQTGSAASTPTLASVAHEAGVGSLPMQSAAAVTTRVLHLINGDHYSGAERVQDLLALHLPKFGYDLSFACLKPGKFTTVRMSLDAPLLEMPMTSRFQLGVAWRLAKLVRRMEYSLLHSHTPRTALIGSIVSRLTGTPLVHHIHSPTSRDSTRYLQNLANTWVERICIRRAAMLIPVSHSLAAWLSGRGLSEERIQVVPNGVPAASVMRPPIAPRGTWVLGIVALFRPRKGMEVLLQALGDLRMASLDVRLRAVGPFESEGYEQAIRLLARQLRIEHAIDWIGFTDNVAGELAKMDLMILPSLFGEGLPMVVLEAMAAGVPIVASAVEGIPEAIRPDEDGVLVAPGSPAALAQGIRRFLSGELDWNRIRQNALVRHAGRFSADAMASQVARVYDRVLRVNRRPRSGTTERPVPGE